MAQSINDYLKSYGVDSNARYSNGTAGGTYNPTTKTVTTTTSTPKTTTASSGSSKSSSKSSSSSKTSSGSTLSPAIQDYLASNGVTDTGARYSDGTAGGTYTPSTGVVTAYDKIAGTTNTYTPSNSMASYLKSSGVDPNARYEQPTQSANPFDAYMDRIEKDYADQRELIEKQNKLAVEQGTNRLNAQKTNVNQAADNNARQAYVNYMQSKKALPQQLAVQGVNGGATETANLGLATAYQNNVNDIEQSRANAIQDIDNAIVDLQNSGDLATVEQVLANNQSMLDSYGKAIANQASYNQWLTQYNDNKEQQDWENWARYVAPGYYNDYTQAIYDLEADNKDGKNDQKIAYLTQLRQQKLNDMAANESAQAQAEQKAYQQQWENDLAQAKLMASMGDFSGLQALGYDTSALQKQWNTNIANTQSQIAKRSSSGSSSGGSSSGSSKSNQTYSQVLSAIQAINKDEGTTYNTASARYLVNSDLDMESIVSIMKQTNTRPENVVREMIAQGYGDDEVKNFVESYTNDQQYRDALFKYAHA